MFIADGPSPLCIAQRRDGSQCKSKATAGSQFCWVSIKLVVLLYYLVFECLF